MRDFQQTPQVFRLLFVQINKLHTKSESVTMMFDFTFEIKPFIVRQKHAERDDLSHHHLAHCVEIAASFRQISNACRVTFVTALPNRIEVHA